MSTRRRLPPVEQIEAFLQAARASNFRVAADDLALSPSALTRRIQAFSGYVGHALFERSSSGMKLTEAGRQCQAELEPSFLKLREAVAFVGVQHAGHATVKVSLSHSLAASWLIPRLAKLQATHPHIELTIIINRRASEVRSGEADLAICHIGVDTEHLEVEPLLDVVITPVAAPDVAAAFASGQTRLEDQRLLASAQLSDLWARWAEATRFPGQLGAASHYDVLHGMYEAAAYGLGVALGANPTVSPYLDAGRLVPLGFGTAKLERAYRLVAAPQRLRTAHVKSVWRWLLEEARDTRCSFFKAAQQPEAFCATIAAPAT